jgi:XXXCH domain-containing protein
MGDKIDRQYLRRDLADFLENLARRLRDGSFEIGGERWEVPEQLNSKIEVWEKKGCVQAHLHLQWPLGNVDNLKLLQERCRRQRDFTELKNQLAEAFSELLELAQMWLLPAESQVMKFMELSREFVLLADPEWEDEITEYMAHAENLFFAVKNKQLEIFLHELRDLKVLVKTCHQERR